MSAIHRGEDIVRAGKILFLVVLDAMGLFPVDDFVEVVFFYIHCVLNTSLNNSMFP